MCDGVDNDCNGTVDGPASDDAEVWYRDTDGDGFGSAATTTVDCDPPSGYVALSTDCNDASAAAHPGGTEVCDTVDNDCDGATDEASATDASTWYLDADGDGYGLTTSTTAACAQPAGYVANSLDCNDGSSAIHPLATEYCDSVDNDCDGTIDESSAVDAATWYLDDDGDGYGVASGTYVSCSMPKGYSATDDDCDDADGTSYPGASEACDGADNDCDGTLDDGATCPCTLVTSSTSAYQFCASPTKAWIDAASFCTSYGYHLVEIDDASENSLLLGYTSTSSMLSYWWMGYNDRSAEGTWVWHGGGTSTYTNWGTAEPSDTPPGEDCGATLTLGAGSVGTWSDEACALTLPFVCEAE